MTGQQQDNLKAAIGATLLLAVCGLGVWLFAFHLKAFVIMLFTFLIIILWTYVYCLLGGDL